MIQNNQIMNVLLQNKVKIETTPTTGKNLQIHF